MENLQEESFATQPVELQTSGTERDSFGELQVLLHQSHVSTWRVTSSAR